MYIINFNQIKCMWIKWTIFGTIPHLLSEEKMLKMLSNQQSNTWFLSEEKEELVSTHRALNTAPRYESNRTLQGWLQNTAWCPEPVSVLVMCEGGGPSMCILRKARFSLLSHQPAKSWQSDSSTPLNTSDTRLHKKPHIRRRHVSNELNDHGSFVFWSIVSSSWDEQLYMWIATVKHRMCAYTWTTLHKVSN